MPLGSTNGGGAELIFWLGEVKMLCENINLSGRRGGLRWLGERGLSAEWLDRLKHELLAGLLAMCIGLGYCVGVDLAVSGSTDEQFVLIHPLQIACEGLALLRCRQACFLAKGIVIFAASGLDWFRAAVVGLYEFPLSCRCDTNSFQWSMNMAVV
jgi:hypothetical protein